VHHADSLTAAEIAVALALIRAERSPLAYTASDLARSIGLSIKTVQRTLAALRERGVSLHYDSPSHCWRAPGVRRGALTMTVGDAKITLSHA